ncbi:hypothetical protein GF345_03035 [Candidatus Woesearchaeota archaeon]|nr:hypothetical protein [Candidatus Woesearchaeota archaeon]
MIELCIGFSVNTKKGVYTLIRTSRNLKIILSLILLISVCAVCVSGASVLIQEIVSKESNLDSSDPEIVIDSSGIIHAVWSDNTDLSRVIGSSNATTHNGLDKDIFYNHRENETWSRISLIGTKISGGLIVLSNSSMKDSVQPAIDTDSDNLTHVVWSSLEPPSQLRADANTTFLMHFNSSSSIRRADYAVGTRLVQNTGSSASDYPADSNGLIGNSFWIKDSESYLNFTVPSNFDSAAGTIELWFNPGDDLSRITGASDKNVLVRVLNSRNTSQDLVIYSGFNHQPGVFMEFLGAEHLKSEASYIFPLKKNEWHHLAVTYNLTNLSVAEFRMYIDGYLAAVNTSSVNGFSFDSFCIGPCNMSVNPDVRIDELRLSRNIKGLGEISPHAGNRSIFYRNIANRSDISSTYRLTDSDNMTYYPRIDIDPEDNIHLVYNEVVNRTFVRVMYMLRNSTSWSDPELVSEGASIAYLPDIAVDKNKTAHVVWEEFSQEDLNISYIHYENRPFSGTWQSEYNLSNASYNAFTTHDYYGRQTISGYFPKQPRIDTDESNITHIVWADNINFPDPGLTFYASYDEGFNATYSKGSRIAEHTQVSLEKGTNSSSFKRDFFTTRYGVNVTKSNSSAHMNYSTQSNFNMTKGSVSLWFKPNFNVSDSVQNYTRVFLSASNSEQEGITANQFHLGLISSGTNLYVFLMFFDQDSTPDDLLNHIIFAGAEPTGWEHQWKHLGFSWHANESGRKSINITIDGVLQNLTRYPDNNNPVALNDSYPRFYIGAMHNVTIGFYNQSDGVIDELKIYNTTRTEEQFYGDMINDFDIYYRKRAADGTWSDISLASNESGYMAVTPDITHIDDKAYIAWSQAENTCDLTSVYYYCALFRIFSGRYNSGFDLLREINDESLDGGYSPSISSYSNILSYAWEDESDFSGSDRDIQFRQESNSTRPVVNVTTKLNGQIFTVSNFSLNSANLTLNATASDIDASDTIGSVAFYYTSNDFSGGLACNATGSSPFSCTWNYLDVFEDFYRIKAVATSSDNGMNWDVHEDSFYLETTPAMISYIFNTSNIDNRLYYKTYYNWTDSRRFSVSSGRYGTQVTNSYYFDAISSPDGVFYQVVGYFTGDIINGLMAVMPINESVSDIKSLNIYWKGRGYEIVNYLTNMSIWNFNTSSWEPVQYKDFIKKEDDLFRHSISEDIDHYLEPDNNSVFILVETQDYRAPTKQPLPCPVYSSWNSTDYVFEAEGLLGLMNRQMEGTTYHRLDHAEVKDSIIRTMISEIVPEVLYLNKAELIAVDHAEGTEAYIDLKGAPRTLAEIQKVKCTDSFGDDCTGLVAYQDEMPPSSSSSLYGGLVSGRSNTHKPPVDYPGNAWVSDISNIDIDEITEDHITITLPEPSDIPQEESEKEKAKLVISGSDTGLMSFSETMLFAMGIDNLPIIFDAIDNTVFGRIMEDKIVSSARITLQVLDKNGEWIDYPEQFSNAVIGSYETLIFPLDMSMVRDNKVRIKTTAFAYMIDFIGVDYSKDRIIYQEHMLPHDITESKNPESQVVNEDLRHIDESRAIISYGESLEISFQTPKPRQDSERTYFLSTTGYYHPLESMVLDKEEDYRSDVTGIAKAFASTPVYAMMYADTDYARRYFIERYIDGGFNRIKGMQGILGMHQEVDIPENLYMGNDGGHNTLYTDLMKVTVSTCSVPYNNMEITRDTVLCSGMYSIEDDDYDQSEDKIGVIRINTGNVVLDCNSSTLSGGGSNGMGNQKGAGFAIAVNSSSNVTIKNCNIDHYEFAIAANNSDNLRIYNNQMDYNDVAVGFGMSHDSLVYNNTATNIGQSTYALTDSSTNNTFENNTASNNFAGFYIDHSHNNTLRNNLVNVTAQSFDRIAGMVVSGNSMRNLIDNNSIIDVPLGVGIADVGRFLGYGSSGKAGRWNNFSRNIVTGSIVASFGFALPYTSDYFNLFEQSNLADGEPLYYYVNQHGTPSDYLEIKDLNLSTSDVSMFMGKITLVNCSYINISGNTLANNYYNLLLVNSTNITVSKNIIPNPVDTFNVYGDKDYSTFAAVGIQVISGEDISIYSNNLSSGLFGLVSVNESIRLNISDNNIKDITHEGLALYQANDSIISENNISDSDTGALIYHSNDLTSSGNMIASNSRGYILNSSSASLNNDTLFKNEGHGLVIDDCRGYLNYSGTISRNNSGHGVVILNCSNKALYNISSSNNSLSGIYIEDSRYLDLHGLESNYSTWGLVMNNTNNSEVYDSYFANNSDAQILFIGAYNNSIIHSEIIEGSSGYSVNSSLQSDNILLNTTFNGSSTAYGDTISNLSVQWHLDFYVQDNESAVLGQSIPISSVNISINNSKGANQRYLFTDVHGNAYFNVSQYYENSSSREYYSNYTWDLNRLGYNFSTGQIRPYITETNMSANRFFNLSMVLMGGISDTDPPTDPIVVDGLNYRDVDWISNRTALSASWYNSTDRHLIFYSYIILENGTCLSGHCSEASTWLDTQVTVTGLNLTEGRNYTFAVRARDSLYWYTPFSYSDGAIADFTRPNVSVSSSTHSNQSVWYNNVNATLNFNGTDSLSGISAFSYVLDQTSGTGPDLIAEPRPSEILHEAKNDGYGTVLKTNSLGEAFSIFYEVRGNLSQGDNVSITMQLSEDDSDTFDNMSIEAYLLSGFRNPDEYGLSQYSISDIGIISRDISHNRHSSADAYSIDLTVEDNVNTSFYVVIRGYSGDDDDNTNNLSIAGSTRDVDNTTDVIYCGESTGCTNLTDTADYAITVTRTSSSNSWSKTYYNLDPGEHYFHVRALDVAGNWGEPAHYRIRVDAESGPPEFVNIKPRGYVRGTSPELVVETNEYATCYYNTTGTGYTKMTSYNGLYHEYELTLSEGNYTYGFNCTDKSGNSAYNDTTFLIDPDAVPDSLAIEPMDSYTAGQRISVYVNVTKQYNGIDYGLGELSLTFTANITNSTPSTYGIPIDVTDKGDGRYLIEFVAPQAEGTYTIEIGTLGVSDTENFDIESYTLTIRYTGTTDLASYSDRVTYGKVKGDFTVGLATEAEPASISASTGELALKYISVEGTGFIFLTEYQGSPETVDEYLEDRTFLDKQNPSFGHSLFIDEHIVSTILDYEDIHIVGSDIVQQGRYSILIRNDGINSSSGKAKIRIEII